MLRHRLSAGALRARAQIHSQSGPRPRDLIAPRVAVNAKANITPSQQQSASLASGVLLGTQRTWKNETVLTLKAELKRRGLSQQGNKAALVARLTSADTTSFAPPVPPVKVTQSPRKRSLSTAANDSKPTFSETDQAPSAGEVLTTGADINVSSVAAPEPHDITPEQATSAPGLPLKKVGSGPFDIKFPSVRPIKERPQTIHVRHFSSNLPREPLRMPLDMPREDYATPAMYSVGLLGRTLKYVVIGVVGLAGFAFLSFEGLHMYVEKVALAAPTRANQASENSATDLDDQFAWADENQAWTGGAHGGTDTRLGWRARHALRGAWICWEWGAGDSGAIGKATATRSGIHPDLGRGASGTSPFLNRVDRGYELADEYIDAAISQALKRDIAFPPDLLPDRPPGPPETEAETQSHPPTTLSSANQQVDPTALDLLMLKAGILERLGTVDALAHAREVYERVLLARVQDDNGNPVSTARVLRLAHKLGDLAIRAGENTEAGAWWRWGLRRAGIALPTGVTSNERSDLRSTASRNWWWWPFRKTETTPTSNPQDPVLLPSLAPPVLRAATSLLISVSAADARQGTPEGLSNAAATQGLALSLLHDKLPNPMIPPTTNAAPTSAETLHWMWIAQRASLLTLHRASVAHARNETEPRPLDIATSAAERSESLLSTLTPNIPTEFTTPAANALRQPAKRLLRDALMTAAESYYVRAVLLERSADTSVRQEDRLHRLEHAGECFERAMSFSAAESGQMSNKGTGTGDDEAVGRGEDWIRFWRGYVRCREKIVQTVTEPTEPDNFTITSRSNEGPVDETPKLITTASAATHHGGGPSHNLHRAEDSHALEQEDTSTAIGEVESNLGRAIRRLSLEQLPEIRLPPNSTDSQPYVASSRPLNDEERSGVWWIGGLLAVTVLFSWSGRSKKAVDVVAVSEQTKEIVDETVAKAKEVAGRTEQAVGTVKEEVKEAATTVKSEATSAANAVHTKAAEAVESARTTANETADHAKAVAETVTREAQSVVDNTKKAVKDGEEYAEKGWEALKKRL